ncbi:kelch-like protein 17 [Ixodes scapularis]
MSLSDDLPKHLLQRSDHSLDETGRLRPVAQSKSTMAISSTPADPDLIEMIVEDETITFSRSLLMQCSPFFQNTFKDGRARKKRVVVSGVSGQTFKDLLEYMKTGKLELSCNNVAEIFHAACKLQMPDIICRCIEMETHTSPIGRQIILYKTAKRMSIPEEKNSAFHHLISNFSLVSESKEFLELDAKDVCELLSADVLGCRGEMDVFSAACHWINHKVHPRMAYASRLMHCVRFALMNLIELNQCLETKTPPGLSNIRSVRIMILSAVCFWVAKAAGKEAEVSHLARKSRQYKVLSKKSSLKVGSPPNMTWSPRYCPCWYSMSVVYWGTSGGFENFSPVNLEKTSSRCCFWYEVSRGQWGIMAPLNSTRAYHGLAVLGNSVYAVGGVDSNNRLLGCVERYDKTMDEWTKLSSELYSPRMAMGSCGHRGQLWVAGGIVQIGRRTCSTAYVEVYSPEAERWSFAVNFLPSPRSCLTLVECDGILYAVGGLLSHRAGKQRSFTTVEDMLVLVDDRNAWVDKTPMPMARHSVVTTTHALFCRLLRHDHIGVAEACGAPVGAAGCRGKPVFGFNGATYNAAEPTAPCAVQSSPPLAAEERRQWEVA